MISPPPHHLRLLQMEAWTTKVQRKVRKDTFLLLNVPWFLIAKTSILNKADGHSHYPLKKEPLLRSWGKDAHKEEEEEFCGCWRSPYISLKSKTWDKTKTRYSQWVLHRKRHRKTGPKCLFGFLYVKKQAGLLFWGNLRDCCCTKSTC